MISAPHAATLQMVRCTRCQRVDTPTHLICRGCLGSELEPVEVPGEGTLVSWTTIRRAPTRFRDDAPYKVAVVDLDAGMRVVGRLAGDSAEPSYGGKVTAVSEEGSSIVFSVSQA
jgi:uncharacterized OB-fold protein